MKPAATTGTTGLDGTVPPVPPEAEVYTLRVWRHGSQFRAVLRAVGGEQLHLFNEPRLVAEFLSHAEKAPARREP